VPGRAHAGPARVQHRRGILAATFRALAEAHDNVGLTLQAHLHRTAEDLDSLIGVGAKFRLVKGVYNEDPAVALPRGPQLDARYKGRAGRPAPTFRP